MTNQGILSRKNHLSLTGNEIYELIESTHKKLDEHADPNALMLATYTVLEMIMKERKKDAFALYIN